MTNLAISFGASPNGSGALAPQTALPAPANQVTLWPPSGRQPPRLTLVTGGGLTLDEYRLMLRALSAVSARRAMRLHPWLRALDLSLMAAEQIRTHGVEFPELGDVPPEFRLWELPGMIFGMYDMLTPWNMTVRNPVWTRNPNIRSNVYSNPVPLFAPVSPNASRGMSEYRRTDNNARIGNLTVQSGVAWYAVGSRSGFGSLYYLSESQLWYATASGVAAGIWPPNTAGIPALTVQRAVYPSAGILPQIEVVPHQLVGAVNRWREFIAPRPDQKPIRESPIGLRPAPAPAPSFPPSLVFAPSAPPKAGPTHRNEPPSKGTKERKAKVRFAVAKMFMNWTTESVDAIEAVWYSLPPKYRTARATPQQMLMDLYRHAEHIQMEVAVRNLVLANLQDKAIGKLSAPLQRAFRKYRPDREFAFYGPV